MYKLTCFKKISYPTLSDGKTSYEKLKIPFRFQISKIYLEMHLVKIKTLTNLEIHFRNNLKQTPFIPL